MVFPSSRRKTSFNVIRIRLSIVRAFSPPDESTNLESGLPVIRLSGFISESTSLRSDPPAVIHTRSIGLN